MLNLLVLLQYVSPKCPTFFTKKTLEKWDTLGTFTQKGPFLDYNKIKKEKKVGLGNSPILRYYAPGIVINCSGDNNPCFSNFEVPSSKTISKRFNHA